MMAEQAIDMTELVRTGEALEARTRAEIDIQISTAKRFPRPELSIIRDKVRDLALVDQETAESCWYALPRAGKVIEGPGVRFTEILATCYQNLRMAGRVVGIDEKFVTCEGACLDLENNVGASSEVKRRITDKYGKRFKDDMIVVTANAAIAIATRNAIFKVVPRGLFKTTLDEIRKVGMGDERSLTQTRDAALAYFAGQGVNEERVLALIEKHAREDMTHEDVSTLRGLVTALKEGATTVDDAFPQQADSGKLKAGKHKMPPKKKAEPKAEPPPPTDPNAPAFDVKKAAEEIQDAIEKAIAKQPQDDDFLKAFDAQCVKLGRTGKDWDKAGEGVIEKLLSVVRDLAAGQE